MYTLQQVGRAPIGALFSQIEAASSLTSVTNMGGRVLEENEKASESKVRRQERHDHRVQDLLAKSGRKACPSSYKENRQVRPQDLDNRNVHEIRSTCHGGLWPTSLRLGRTKSACSSRNTGILVHRNSGAGSSLNYLRLLNK